MMTAWAATLITHRSGGEGRMLSHETRLEAPFLYGDVLQLDGTVAAVDPAEGWPGVPDGRTAVTVAWGTVNQRDETSFRGESVVGLPR